MEVAVCQYGGKLLKRRIGKCCEFLGQTSQCIGRVSCICRKTKSNDKSAICDTDNKFCKQDQDVQQDVWLQVVFCVVPLFSSLCAYLLLGERALGLLGWIGGFLVILAGVVVSMHKSQKLN
eukprot:TRINITY_DN20958_c0_g2_i1.p4 TRINITY_DN20958_c0_g2~~TRINITY_DN20958_c0_g2_i1.p4  ORF type:complete len:121 (-),score=4.69 TRINITY_DN20958_c0_g2_i1:264-626(-)